MVRKIVIALAAAGAVIAGSALDASARMGGGHGGMGGMSRGSIGHVGMGSAGFARMGGPGIGRAAIGPGSFGRFGVAHPRIAHSRFFFRHHRFHNRFFFAAAFPYGYSCYERVWTRWGWRLINVCGYGGYGPY